LYNWGKKTIKTTYYTEYKIAERKPFQKTGKRTHQLTDQECSAYILENVFRGWDTEV
jgi:pectinesterase